MSTSDATSIPSASPWRFWAAVKAELRATWGRRRPLWVVLAVILEVGIVLLSASGLGAAQALMGVFQSAGLPGEAAFLLVLLCAFFPLALTLTAAAYLGSDLLSIRFKENPEPLREWPPREFLARAVGRLLPFAPAAALWLATWEELELLAPTSRRGKWMSAGVGAGVAFVSGAGSRGEALQAFAGMLLVLAAFFVHAALLSAVSKRPRRWGITGATWVLTLLLAGVLQAAAYAAGGARDGYLLSQLLWLAESAAAAGLTWWIAERRFRRHPSNRTTR